MPIDFTHERYERVAENSRLWWAGELKRPLIQVTTRTHDPGRFEPALDYRFYNAAYEDSTAAETIIDRLDYDLSCLTFHGDAFPHNMPFFGAGVLAAFLGAELDQREETCWFHPPDEREAPDLSFRFSPENRWYKRISDIYAAGVERWDGLVQLAITDLGGNLDILSSFRPGEKLLLDLYDHPDDVKRLTWETHDLWWQYYDAFDSMIRPPNHGCTAWTPIFSVEPYYMLQCDFAYMISSEMFDEFVRPELAASCRRLGNAFYHLDGPGQLVHLDSLLSIDELKGIQWIPGGGSPGVGHWPEVYKKIRDAGKLIQFFGDIGDLDTIAGQIGSAEGLALICMDFDNPTPKPSETEIIDALDRYRVI